MSRPARFLIGLVVLSVPLLATGWFDSVVAVGAQHEQSRTFNLDVILLPRALGFLLIAASILVIAVAGWRLRSVGLGIAYVLVGAFFTFFDTILWKLAASVNGAAPVLPEPIAQAISNVYVWQTGPLNGTLIVGAGALIVGLVMVAAQLAQPRSERRSPSLGYLPSSVSPADRLRPRL